MSNQLKWIERKFNFTMPDGKAVLHADLFPVILERFRGTSVRLAEMTKGLTEEVLTFKPGSKWSIKEHAGHLIDLEELGEKRLNDYLYKKEVLSNADITNQKTSEKGYNYRNMDDLLNEFSKAREHLVNRLENLTEEQVSEISVHPRLNQKMRVIDWLYFMCEHDDHHLAKIRGIIIAQNNFPAGQSSF